jgi:opacity protein-like surface antigen
MKKLLGAAALLTLAVGVSPAMAQVGSGVYIRVDAGGGFSTNMAFKDTDPRAPNTTLGGLIQAGDAGTSGLLSAGMGVRLSPAFRLDLTGSYLPWLRFSGHDCSCSGSTLTSAARIKSSVGMVNGYVDFAGLAGLPASSAQPYLVASVGAARNQLDSFTISSGGVPVLTINGKTKMDVAWGLGAGVGFPLGRFVTFDLMYKYLDLGEVRSSDQLSLGALTATGTPITAQLHVHTLTAGLRIGF